MNRTMCFLIVLPGVAGCAQQEQAEPVWRVPPLWFQEFERRNAVAHEATNTNVVTVNNKVVSLQDRQTKLEAAVATTKGEIFTKYDPAITNLEAIAKRNKRMLENLTGSVPGGASGARQAPLRTIKTQVAEALKEHAEKARLRDLESKAEAARRKEEIRQVLEEQGLTDLDETCRDIKKEQERLRKQFKQVLKDHAVMMKLVVVDLQGRSPPAHVLNFRMDRSFTPGYLHETWWDSRHGKVWYRCQPYNWHPYPRR